MPFARQTLQQLAAQIKAGFQAALAGADAALRRSNLAVAAITTAAAVDGEYAYLDWTIDNALMPDTAVAPYSLRWGALKGVTPKGPVAATGTANFANCIVGTVIPSGTILQLQPGVTFQTTGAATIGAGGTASVAIAAILPTAASDGSQWNCDAGAGLTLATAIPGIDGGQITVTANIDNGAGPETNAAFVARYLQVFRAPPQGGDAQDYVEWALAQPAVTRAWCVSLQKGVGTVVVYFMEDVAEAAHQGFPQGTNGVATAETRDAPATGDQLALANALYPLRPVTALVYAFAPAANPVPFSLKYVPGAQQGLVTAAIAAVLTAEGAADGTGSVLIEDIRQAVRAVPQCNAAIVIAPNDNIANAVGLLPMLGALSWF